MTTQRLRFVWILSPARDLLFYIGSVAAGWTYVAVILFAAARFESPLEDSFGSFSVGAWTIPLNLELLVVVSWALILDAPHVWATLARTLFDPDEWRVRRTEILRSFGFFLAGPLLILAPYAVGVVAARAGRPLPAAGLGAGAVVFFVLFRLWAYHHVVRQHWGFFRLYQRRAGELSGVPDRWDTWFFNAILYLPLAMFVTSPFYAGVPGNPDLGMRSPIWGDWSLGSVAYPLLWAAFLAVLVGYLVHQARLWWSGATLNGSKLLYMLPLVPLHLAVFSHPLLAVFVVPIVTVGHNIQYHAIVYSYARNKYPERGREFRWAKALFRNFAVYAAIGFLFGFLLYKGPLVGWFEAAAGAGLDEALFNSFGMMAGIRDPAKLALGQRVLAALILGFAMQHYYLDSKIWKVGRDREVRRHLGV